jgi:RimJ/RimL family protein N-acetyltransferase
VGRVRLRPIADGELPAHIAQSRAEYAEGITRAELNVFGGNERARSLYRSLGYRELGIAMGKDLDG